METASMAVFAPGIAVLLSLQQLDIRKVNPQIRAYVNHLHIPQPTYFRPNRLRNKQKDLLFQYPGFPETGIFPGKRGETGNRHRAPLYGDCLYGGFLHPGCMEL